MNSILSFITWNPNPEMFNIFGISIRYYSIMWAIGLLCAYFIVKWLYKDQKIKAELFDPLFFYCFFGILIGARLGHCFFYDWSYYSNHLWEIVLPAKFTDTGMKFTGYQGLASHGGTIGLMVALWLYVRKYKLNFVHVLDNIAIATPITACFIRLGNFMNSEIIGKATESNWGVIFSKVDSVPRHPSQFYEAMAYLLFFFVELFLYKKYKNKLHRGFFFGLCLTLIFTFRFFVEFTKEPQEAFEATMTLNMGQLLSIPFVVLGIACMIGGKWLQDLGCKETNVYLSDKKK